MSITLSRKIVQDKMTDYNNLLQKVGKHPGYVGKLTEYLFSGVDINDLYTLYDNLVGLSHRNVNIDIYQGSYGYEKVCDVIIKEQNKILIKTIRSELTKVLRDSYDGLQSYSKNMVNLLFLELAKRDDRKAFISKMSRYKKISEVEASIKIFLKDGIIAMVDIIKKVESLDTSYVVGKGDDFLVIQVGSNSDMTELGSDTSWCIVNSISNWNYYTKGATQFILYDFTKDVYEPKSKIGFTIKSNGYVSAKYDKVDTSISDDEFNAICVRFGINKKILIHTPESSILILQQISKSTSYARYDIFANNCEKSDSIKFCKKLLSFNRIDLRKVYSSIAIAIDRTYDHISTTEIDTMLGFGVGDSLVRHTLDSIYSERGLHLDRLSLDFIKRYAVKMNLNQMTFENMWDYVKGVGKLDDDKRRFLYMHLRANYYNFTYTDNFDRVHYRKLLFLLSYSDNYIDGNSDEFTDGYNLLTYKEKILISRILPNNTLRLEEGENGYITIPFICIDKIQMGDYSNIHLHSNNFKRVMNFIEYNSKNKMTIAVDEGLWNLSGSDWKNHIQTKLFLTLISVIKNPGVVEEYNGISYYMKPKK